ncbi:hypothetical protein CYMTET_31534, partial [Cymbomonas tetramitiformis]
MHVEEMKKRAMKKIVSAWSDSLVATVFQLWVQQIMNRRRIKKNLAKVMHQWLGRRVSKGEIFLGWKTLAEKAKFDNMESQLDKNHTRIAGLEHQVKTYEVKLEKHEEICRENENMRKSLADYSSNRPVARVVEGNAAEFMQRLETAERRAAAASDIATSLHRATLMKAQDHMHQIESCFPCVLRLLELCEGNRAAYYKGEALASELGLRSPGVKNEDFGPSANADNGGPRRPSNIWKAGSKAKAGKGLMAVMGLAKKQKAGELDQLDESGEAPASGRFQHAPTFKENYKDLPFTAEFAHEILTKAEEELSQCSPEELLLRWANLRLRPHGINVSNFHADWNDVGHFTAIVHALGDCPHPRSPLAVASAYSHGCGIALIGCGAADPPQLRVQIPRNEGGADPPAEGADPPQRRMQIPRNGG